MICKCIDLAFVMSPSESKPEVWIGTKGGAVKTWAVRRRVKTERWDKHAIARFKATPEDPGTAAADDAPGPPEEDGAEEEPPTEEEAEEERHRYLRLRAKDFEWYGHSEECAGCARMRRGAKPPYRHNQECRRRLEKSIKRDDRARWDRYLIRKPPESPARSDPTPLWGRNCFWHGHR